MFIASVAFVVITFFLSMVLGVILFFDTPEGVSLSQLSLRGLVVNLFVIFELELPFRLSVGSLFLGLWVVYLACLIVAWAGPKERFDRALELGFTSSIRSALTSPMFAITVIASMLLDLVLVLQSLQEAAGIATGSIELSDPFAAFLSLTYAPLMETVGFRLTPIGAFLVPYLLWRGRRKVAASDWQKRLRLALEAFLNPEGAKGRLGLTTVWGSGLRRGVTLPEWAVVALAAFGFGLAHFYSGAGWDIGKVSTAAIAGFCFGAAYLVYGAHAAILLHWVFDYYFTAYALAATAFSGRLLVVNLLVNSMAIGLGLAAWAGLLALGVVRVVRKVRPPRAPPPVVPQPFFRVKYCLFCGFQIQGDVVFCTECGKRQEPNSG